jgi:hypothetical protein
MHAIQLVSLILILLPGDPPVPSRNGFALPDITAPASFKTAEMRKALGVASEGEKVSVLVWEMFDADAKYPLSFPAVERCVLLIQLARPTKDGESWTLANVYRSPKTGTDWMCLSHTVRDKETKQFITTHGFQNYKSPPTDVEIANFLKTRNWDWRGLPGERILMPSRANDGEILAKTTVQYEPRFLKGGVDWSAWKKIFAREPGTTLFPEFEFLKAE